MKRLLTLAAAALCLTALASPAPATIGWAGNVWPNSGASVVPTGPVDCYVQVWKGGVTDAEGQGAGIEVVCDMTNDIGGLLTTIADYNSDIGNNDEYTTQIPQSLLLGAAWVEIHFKAHDLTDDTWYEGTNDQAGNPPPQRYNVSDVLPNPVDVTFTLCMSGTATTGAPCVIGSAPEIGAWGAGVPMTNVGGELWAVTVTFAAGSNPSFEYKYRKDDCTTWEGTDNRAVTLPTDGTTVVDLAADSWEFQPIGCGLGDVLLYDRTVCFQVCLSGVETTGEVCVIGSAPQLGSWVTGVTMGMIGPSLYQACVVFPAGTAVPLAVEYKFRKDGCDTWESVGNRTVMVSQDSPDEQTLSDGWDDGPFDCTPVAAEPTTWGSVKGMYR